MPACACSTRGPAGVNPHHFFASGSGLASRACRELRRAGGSRPRRRFSCSTSMAPWWTLCTSTWPPGTTPSPSAASRLSVWRIHRRIGMSGGLFLNALQRETGLTFDAPTLAKLSSLHEQSYLDRVKSVVPLPGTTELLDVLLSNRVPFAIATSGAHSVADAALGLLDLPASVPVVTRRRCPASQARPRPVPGGSRAARSRPRARVCSW